MLRWSIAACVIAGTMVLAAPASARNYDCSKAGNANKAECKAKLVAAPKPVAAPAATKPAAVAARNYDCSKAGNATKAACKGVAVVAPKPMVKPAPVVAVKPVPAAARPAPAPAFRPMPVSHPQAPAQPTGRIVAWTTKTGKVVHYDCSKAGNLNKQACKQ
jgi:hypothetical protein